jgi:hypothetical protein
MKIDSWFGSRWLGFSGKALGLVSIRNKPYKPPYRLADKIRIPPFVPARVLSQRRFSAPDYREVDPREPLHLQIPSTHALRRKAAEVAPGELLTWYSGSTAENGRGSLMAYVPVEGSYWAWYVGFERDNHWRIRESWDIKSDMFLALVEEGAKSCGESRISLDDYRQGLANVTKIW